jgi:hypothetical protein
VVAESSSPIAIPALAGALGSGRVAEDGLVKFGEAAVPTIITIGRNRVGLITTGSAGDTPPHVVASALTVLAPARRQWAEHALNQITSGYLGSRERSPCGDPGSCRYHRGVQTRRCNG